MIKKSSTGKQLEAYQNAQNHPDQRGYQTFTISEGVQAILLSLGEEMAGDNIEVLNVDEVDGKTIVYVKSFYNKSSEKNPTIIIGLDRLQPEIEIRDTDGTIYEKIK